jgi:transposase
VYILAKSEGRLHKERAIRRRKLKRLWQRLQELQQQKLTRDQGLVKLGAAKKEAGRSYFLVELRLPQDDEDFKANGFRFKWHKDKLRKARRGEGHYRLRSNPTQSDPARLWQYYIQLTEIEQAFKELKGDLAIRPIYHPLDERIEAHSFVAFGA